MNKLFSIPSDLQTFLVVQIMKRVKKLWWIVIKTEQLTYSKIVLDKTCNTC